METRPRIRWENKIKIKEVEWKGVCLRHLAWDKGQAAGCCEYDDEPSGPIKCGEIVTS